MTKEEIIEECKQRLGFETDCEIYTLCQHEKDFYNAIIKELEQQPSDESIKYLECNNIDVQKFTKALKMQPLQIIKPNTSDDCVSRQAILDGVKSMSNANPSYWITCDLVDREDLINGIQSLPPVTPTQRWIPVSEKLPEEGKEVLAYYEYFRYGDYNCMQTTYGVGYQYDGLWCGDIRGHKLNVIAWQPLPVPYKEKRGNENEVN